MEKFVLKFLWLEKSIAVAIDQKLGETTSPITDYFFWPRKDAWEELKNQLETKPWISQHEAITLLNQTTEIINYWQEEGKTQSLIKVQEKYPEYLFIGK